MTYFLSSWTKNLNSVAVLLSTFRCYGVVWSVAKQVIDVNDHAPAVKVVFLGADDDEAASSGRVSRHARPGDSVARVSVSDLDETDSVTVQLRHRYTDEPRRLPDRTAVDSVLLQNLQRIRTLSATDLY